MRNRTNRLSSSLSFIEGESKQNVDECPSDASTFTPFRRFIVNNKKGSYDRCSVFLFAFGYRYEFVSWGMLLAVWFLGYFVCSSRTPLSLLGWCVFRVLQFNRLRSYTITQIIVGALLGIGAASCWYCVVDTDDPKKMCITWTWILIGNLISAVLVKTFNLL